MNLEETRLFLTQTLREHLLWHMPKEKKGSLGDISDVYEYSLFPTGKLFRALLVWATALDFSKKVEFDPNSNHAYLSSCIEFHHTYSLLHDDLPCMDDDKLRRNKPCTHLAFNEWKALLAGDGFLNCSYQILSKINSEKLPELFKLITGLLGTKGLIHGQVLDLSGEMAKNFPSLLKTHKLKTARLIQASILSSYLLASSNKRHFMNLYRLGDRLGIVFQLLDDLAELTDLNLSDHEREINPWFNFKEKTLEECVSGLKKIKEILDNHQLNNLKSVISDYYKSVEKIKEKPLLLDIPTSKIFTLFKFD